MAASMARAAAFLDETALTWTWQRRCGTCHTNYPYLGAPGSARNSPPRWPKYADSSRRGLPTGTMKTKQPGHVGDAEVVSTGAALAIHGAATTGRPHPLTRMALDRTWSLRSRVGIDWLKGDWPPLEHDDYYGAIVAAIGAGHAPDGGHQSPAAAGLALAPHLFLAEPSTEHPPWDDAALGLDSPRGP